MMMHLWYYMIIEYARFIFLCNPSLPPPPQNEHGSGKKITETSFFNGHLIVIFLMTFAILNQKTSENFYFIDREK